tara:strand:- start:120 stop:599 length:480 start_codon:yes stop_codon:yes gene_type:complete
MLTSWKTVPVYKRRDVLYLLNTFSKDINKARDVEADIHCTSRNVDEYIDKSQQIILNIKNNQRLLDNHKSIIALTDFDMSKGTILEDIERESTTRKTRFEQMLQEKYDMLNDKTFNATLKCRRCGSAEVSWEQKQTRSADEASTVFCTCQKCKNRWTMR